ncbi:MULTISPECIES: nuclear transport factor 2 family protein [unclassified Streptomyces]|uniref:nuclear transport factor 2 family protein n=1 Tax=unclassified Streptomyces TaxID=2593676 RepID=UPI001902E6BE|nr:nuclear transport factor 2 family protein [Streptomyces sp. HSG2]
MTQRIDLADTRDRMAVDRLVTDYAVAVDDGDWAGYLALFAPGGRADYRSAGGVEGDAAAVADWLAEALGPFPVRQHLVVNRRVRLGEWARDVGDTAEADADYVSPLVPGGRGVTGPEVVSGGRCSFALLRTAQGWRLTRVVVREKWRRLGGAATPM